MSFHRPMLFNVPHPCHTHTCPDQRRGQSLSRSLSCRSATHAPGLNLLGTRVSRHLHGALPSLARAPSIEYHAGPLACMAAKPTIAGLEERSIHATGSSLSSASACHARLPKCGCNLPTSRPRYFDSSPNYGQSMLSWTPCASRHFCCVGPQRPQNAWKWSTGIIRVGLELHVGLVLNLAPLGPGIACCTASYIFWFEPSLLGPGPQGALPAGAQQR